MFFNSHQDLYLHTALQCLLQLKHDHTLSFLRLLDCGVIINPTRGMMMTQARVALDRGRGWVLFCIPPFLCTFILWSNIRLDRCSSFHNNCFNHLDSFIQISNLFVFLSYFVLNQINVLMKRNFLCLKVFKIEFL